MVRMFLTYTHHIDRYVLNCYIFSGAVAQDRKWLDDAVGIDGHYLGIDDKRLGIFLTNMW